MKYITARACNVVGRRTIFTIFLADEIPPGRFDALKRRVLLAGFHQVMPWNPHSTVFARGRNKY